MNTISNQVASFYGTFAIFLGSALQIIAYTTYLLVTNTETIIVFLFGGFILIFPTIYLTKLGRKYSHNTYVYGQDISSEIEKVLDNLYLIKIINYVEKELSNFKNSLNDFYSSSLNNLRHLLKCPLTSSKHIQQLSYARPTITSMKQDKEIRLEYKEKIKSIHPNLSKKKAAQVLENIKKVFDNLQDNF